MFRFTIRDVLWLTVVVALGLGWITDRLAKTPAAIWEQRANTAAAMLRAEGWEVSWEREGLSVRKENASRFYGYNSGR